MVREIQKGLGKSGKVREFENNGYCRQTSDNINVFCSRGEKMYFLMR